MIHVNMLKLWHVIREDIFSLGYGVIKYDVMILFILHEKLRDFNFNRFVHVCRQPVKFGVGNNVLNSMNRKHNTHF